MNKAVDHERPPAPWLAWIDRVSAVLATAAGVAAFGMMTNIVADVVGRALFRPLPGTLDITQFAWMPLVVSLGMGYALLKSQHIRIGLLADLASERVQRAVEVFAMFATLVTLSALAWFGAERAFHAIEIGEFSPATTWLPIGVFRWIMVIGLLGLALQALAQLVRAITAVEFRVDDELELVLAEMKADGLLADSNPKGDRA